MKTINLAKPGLFERIETEEPSAPASGEVLVSVRHIGLCGTDIHAYGDKQPYFEYPRILGHELGVEIEALGPNCPEALEVGMRCSVEPYLSHAGDRAFARGKTNCSSSTQCLGVHVDGGMRERILLPANKLHPSDLPTKKLALVETLCIGHHAVGRAQLLGDEVVAVIGMGPIGLGVAQFASLAGANVVCIDISDKRLEKAKSFYPNVTTLKLDPSKAITDTWQQLDLELPEVVFDCTGSKASMEASFNLPNFGGRIVYVGIVKDVISFSDPDFHKRELSIIGSRNATAIDFKSVIEKMESGKVDVEPWMTHTCEANDFPGLIDDWLKPDSGLLKGVIEF